MKKTLLFLVTLALMGFSACSSDDDKVSLPDITVNFTSSDIGLSQKDTIAKITVNLSRKADVNLDVTVTLTPSDSVVYGKSYTTTPAALDNVVKITIPAGSVSSSYTINRKDANLDIYNSITSQITTISNITGFVIGNKAKETLYFDEISSKGDLLTLNGRGTVSEFENSVYVDFSANSQVAINRESWNLGFYNGEDFRVVLNAADATTATASGKTNISEVTLADTANVYNINISATSLTEALSFDVVDTFDGALAGTVFAEVSANENDNQVYFVAPESSKKSKSDWYKVKVNRNSNGYKVLYAKIGDNNIKTLNVPKNSTYNFSFLSFEKGSTVNVEPEAKKWDIMWSYYTVGIWDRPYFAQDVIAINTTGGVQAAQVSVSKTVTYASFTKENLASVELSSSRDIVGTSWRNTSSYNSAIKTGVYANRFYVVKDPEGNYYKLRFLKMGVNNDGGERGRPVIEYALLD